MQLIKRIEQHILLCVTDGSTLRWSSATSGCDEVFQTLNPGYWGLRDPRSCVPLFFHIAIFQMFTKYLKKHFSRFNLDFIHVEIETSQYWLKLKKKRRYLISYHNMYQAFIQRQRQGQGHSTITPSPCFLIELKGELGC